MTLFIHRRVRAEAKEKYGEREKKAEEKWGSGREKEQVGEKEDLVAAGVTINLQGENDRHRPPGPPRTRAGRRCARARTHTRTHTHVHRGVIYAGVNSAA